MTVQPLPMNEGEGCGAAPGQTPPDLAESPSMAPAGDPAGMLEVLKRILNQLDVCVYVTDMKTDQILFINKKTEEIFGIQENIIGQKCWAVIQKGYDQRCPFCPLYKLEREPDVPMVWEALNTVTGRYYKHHDSVIEWTDGRKAHLQYSIDITDVKAMQQETRKSLEVLKNILNGMDAFVYVSDMRTDEILFINHRMKDAFGLDDTAVGKVCWKVLQKGFTQRCDFCPNPQLEMDPSTPLVWKEHNTVTNRHYQNVDSVIEWMDGKEVHMQHSTDITDIVEAQEETRRARERLEIALTASRAGVWELDIESDVLTYDPMCARLFGFDPARNSMRTDDLVAHLQASMLEVTGPDIIKGLLDKDPYAEGPSRDFHLLLPDGSRHHVRNYGNTIRDRDGRALRVIGMCIDITSHVSMEEDLLAAKEAAEKASVAKSQFLSNMSHEIRTPMNAIIGMTEILLGGDLNDRQRHYMQDIKVSSNALLSLINDILDFSKIEAGKLQLVPVDYNPMSMLENLESMFSFAAESKNIYFYLEIRDKLPACLHGDDIRLRQALINVIGNAVKFTKEGGVTLTVIIDGGTILFDVADTGIGIRREDIPSIFNDFGQLDMRKNRSIAGTGLGLSITRNLVAMMGGGIAVDSEYGVGTVFHLRVPLVLGDEKMLAGKTRVFERFEAPDANILVVDDNEVNLNVASGMLELYKIKCDTAASGWEAIRKIGEKGYDIVFMDHMMPEMDGVETTRALRESHDEKELIVVALTANAVEGAKEALLAARMNDYLSKPIDKVELNHILRKWLPAEKIRPEAPLAPEPVAEEPSRPDLIALLRNVEGMDVDVALERIGGMRNVYEKSLEIFTNRLPDTIVALASFLDAENLKRFSIDVHGLKSSLNNIGATGMALRAEELEARSKAADLAYCRGAMPQLVEELSALHDKLTSTLEVSRIVAAPVVVGDAEAARARLAEIRALLDAFEGDRALEMVGELEKFDYGENLNRLLAELRGRIETFDYDGAMAVIDGIVGQGASRNQ